MAQLPNIELAFIDDRKITEYLLSPVHSSGRHKAKFFEAFGFKIEAWQRLRDALLEHAHRNPAVPDEITEYGPTYKVSEPLQAPDGREPYVLVVWMIRNGEEFPRFVTAVPSEP